MTNRTFILVATAVVLLVLAAVTFHTSAGHRVLHAIHGAHQSER